MRTDSAARMLSDDGGPSWNECCWLHKQTHTCERWDPESLSDLLLSLFCCWQSVYSSVWRCLNCDSHVKVRLTETGTEVWGALLAAAAGRSDSVKGTQSCNGEYTDNTAAEEDAHRGASGCGAGRSPVLAGPKVVSTSHDESQRHGKYGVVATCMCDHPSIGKFLRFCITFLCIVARVCSSTHPGRHWPACFDQTCGYPGDGPLTTLDSPDAQGMCLTPTQGVHDVRHDQAQNERTAREAHGVLRVRPPSNPERVVSNAPNAMHGHATRHVQGLLRMYSVAACQALLRIEPKLHWAPQQRSPRNTSIDARHGAGDGRPGGGRAAGGLAVRSATPERVAHQAALQVVPTQLTMPDTPEGVETGQPTQIDMAAPSAGWAVQKPRLPQQWSPGLRRSCWSWRRPCRRCVLSGTSRGARGKGRAHCHHQRAKRRDSESLQAELAAAWWAWLGPPLLVRAHDGGVADNDGLGRDGCVDWAPAFVCP